MSDLHRQVARFMADVADALDGIKSGQTDHGEYYVSVAVIAYDGEDTGWVVAPDEFGGYAISERRDDERRHEQGSS